MEVTSVENGVLITYVFEAQGHVATTKTWIHRDGPLRIIVADLQSICDDMTDNYANTLLGGQATEAVLTDVVATEMDPLDGTGRQVHADPSKLGQHGASGELLPLAASLLLTLKADERGRSYQNRMFIPFPGENMTDHGAIKDTALTGWKNNARLYREAAESTVLSWRIAILRRKDHPSDRTGEVHDCDSIAAASRVAYQLRRSR